MKTLALVLLLTGCQSIPCEEDLTVMMSECLAQQQLQAKRTMKRNKGAILMCKGEGVLKRCEYMQRETMRRTLENMSGRR